MDDFYDWIHSDLQSFISKSATDVDVDTKRIFVYGDSAGKYLRTFPIRYICPVRLPSQSKRYAEAIYAGAYLSVLSAFNQPPGRIRASVAAYPFLDFADPWYHQAFEKRIFGLPQLPAEIVTKHLE
jgi:hypothetical protein